MAHDPLDPSADPFHPPEIPTEVRFLHCGEEYDSYLIQWRVETGPDGKQQGFWCCPTPGCGGCGFGFDILPTDPEYQDERGGWVSDDEDDPDEAGSNGEDYSDEDDCSDEDESLEDDFLPEWPSEDETDEDDEDGPENDLPW
jgi:hypothetical protein